ncbi:MAG: hypothetical protein MRZ54_09410 [Clostridiales bacterium]|nr:hypothetical protein [Clostridiales bacterium]
MKKQPWERLDDAFAPTPQAFHAQVERKLYQVTRGQAADKAPRRGWRLAATLALLAALFCGTALALSRMGVLDFLVGRVADGPTRETLEGGVTLPVAQSCESDRLVLSVRDVYLDAERLAVCVHIAPKDENAYRLLSETDIGADGETFDRIWWNGKIMTFEEWLPKGKEMLVLSPRWMEIGGQRLLSSYDWVPEEQGETFLFEADLWELDDPAAALNADGTLTVRVLVSSRVYGAEEADEAALTFTVPAPDGFGKER